MLSPHHVLWPSTTHTIFSIPEAKAMHEIQSEQQFRTCQRVLRSDLTSTDTASISCQILGFPISSYSINGFPHYRVSNPLRRQPPPGSQRLADRLNVGWSTPYIRVIILHPVSDPHLYNIVMPKMAGG